jgi:hypothetical protein
MLDRHPLDAVDGFVVTARGGDLKVEVFAPGASREEDIARLAKANVRPYTVDAFKKARRCQEGTALGPARLRQVPPGEARREARASRSVEARRGCPHGAPALVRPPSQALAPGRLSLFPQKATGRLFSARGRP